MTNIQQDKRVQHIAIGIILVGAGVDVVAYMIWGVDGMLIAFGLTLLLLLCLVVWLMCFYRCPSCGQELKADEPESYSIFAIRHYCPKCQVTWESGIELSQGKD